MRASTTGHVCRREPHRTLQPRTPSPYIHMSFARGQASAVRSTSRREAHKARVRGFPYLIPTRRAENGAPPRVRMRYVWV
ncbi:hypothetical protein FA95DRAFT_1313615 [Auriscalpium vulgare]|uniref:Uncharacterized protein n=1 Tax=Auriscalpium vulgare TaxID=40419 RepID=A0ACB8R1W2_9AGAM|nr:hypothetical protein FA95DRAFT_1313615 [Auriscalpium vulgare]